MQGKRPFGEIPKTKKTKKKQKKNKKKKQRAVILLSRAARLQSL